MRAATSILVTACVLAPAAVAAAGSAVSGAHTLSATMTPAQVVGPSGKAWIAPSRVAAATGTLSATLGPDGRKLSWHIAYAGLDGPRLVIADVHAGGRGKFGPVVVRLCGPCRSGERGVTRLRARDARALVRGGHFVTLITDRYPNGVARGQLRTG